jgi:hypothetical protein
MKKKTVKKKRPVKQKIDVVLESLLNLETQVKKLIDRIDSLENKIPNYPIYYSPQKYPEQPIVWW